MCSHEHKYDGIKEDNSGGNTAGFPVGKFDDVIFGLFGSMMLGVADSFKLGSTEDAYVIKE